MTRPLRTGPAARLRAGLLTALAAGMSVMFVSAVPTMPVSSSTSLGAHSLDALLHRTDDFPGVAQPDEAARIAAADAKPAAMLSSALTVSGVGVPAGSATDPAMRSSSRKGRSPRRPTPSSSPGRR